MGLLTHGSAVQLPVTTLPCVASALGCSILSEYSQYLADNSDTSSSMPYLVCARFSKEFDIEQEQVGVSIGQSA